MDILSGVYCIRGFGLSGFVITGLMCKYVHQSTDLYDCPGAGTVVNEYGGRPHPSLKVVERQRDVLSEVPVEDPYFAVGRGFGYTVSAIMKENPFIPGVPAKPGCQAADFLQRRIQTLLVAGSRLPSLILFLQLNAYINLFINYGWGH